MEDKLNTLLRELSSLYSRILQNPDRRGLIIQEFYCEKVSRGDTETAHLVLLIKSIAEAAGPLGQNIFINQGNVVMSQDVYKTGQAGAVGPGAHAHDMNFNQIWNEAGSQIDTKQLASDLTQLRSALAKEASEPDHYVALGEVAAAEKAATADDGPKALEHLKKAGAWVWDVGTKVGIGVAIYAAKTALGI